MSARGIVWGDHWGDAAHHPIVHLSDNGSDVPDQHTEGVDNE